MAGAGFALTAEVDEINGLATDPGYSPGRPRSMR
jgi:hypothetical protein